MSENRTVTVSWDISGLEKTPFALIILICNGCQKATHCKSMSGYKGRNWKMWEISIPSFKLPEGWRGTHGDGGGLLCPDCIEAEREILDLSQLEGLPQ